MDNHPFPNAIHVFIAQHPDNDVDTEDMPELVPLDATGSHATEPQPQTTADVEMNGENSNMPSLTSFSDASDEDHDNNDSESDRDAHEVEMQTVSDHRLSDHAVLRPNPSLTSHTTPDQPAVNNNRRARVEDDEDEDRDRRHPSQRIGNSASATSLAGPSSSTPVFPPSQMPTAAPQTTPGARLRGQPPIFTRTAADEATTTRAHPFRFFQHLMSNNINNNDSNDVGATNSVPPSGGPMPAPQPHQDGNTPDNQPHGRHPIIEGFSVTLDIGLGPAFHMGEGAQPSEGEPASNAADPNPNPNPNAQNGPPPNPNFADLMARFDLFGQAMGLGENRAEPTTGGNNTEQGAGGAGATPGAQFGFTFPPGGFNLANLAGLGFGFNLDGSGFAEKEDPERARKLVDGLEEVPVGLVKRLERVGGTGGGMGEDETKGGDGGCAICWDKLLGSSAEEDVHQHEESEQKEDQSERTQREASTDGDEASKPTTPKIVSLPCAHVFHAECLIPWFSRPRQTTCPTCRFNIDPENLTYVSWRRRLRERRERERAEARARGDPENTDGNEAGQDGIAPPAVAAAAATAAEPAVGPLPDAPTIISGNFLPSLESQPLSHVRSRTPDASVLHVHPTPTPRSQSQPPSVQAAASSSSSSAPAPSTSQPTAQTLSRPEDAATSADIHGHGQEAADDWDAMPGLQDMSDSEDEDDNEEEEDEDQDDDEDQDQGDRAQEQGNGHGIPPPPVLPHVNVPPIPSSTSGVQAQAPRPGRNDPLAPRTIQTPHGLVTLIPVPFNFPFPTAGNVVGVGVQAGGNAPNANAPVPPAPGQGQGQLPNVNANANTQALPRGLVFPHFHVQLPHMPEFGAQRGPQGATPAPATPAPVNTTTNNAPANANSTQPIPANPFADAQAADAITNAEGQLMLHLLSQGFTANEAENIRRSTMAGRQADRLGGEMVQLDPEDEDEDDMMDIDEGMGMVVDLAMDQGGIGGADGVVIGADPADIAAQDEQDRQEFAQVINFLSHAARQARGQAQTGTQTQGQAQQQERGTQGGAADTPSAQSEAQPQTQQQQQQQPPPQPQPQQQQGQGFAPFMAGLNAGFNIGNHIGNFEPEDGRTMNEFVAQVFANLMGGPQQRQRTQPAQGQDAQPQAQPQVQPQAGQAPGEGPNPTNADNNDRRPRQQAQFAFGNVTIGPFPNIGSLFDQIPIFNPNGAANPNVNGDAGSGQERVKKTWTLPPAPGPTLRQRIERRERDAGLRCYDISCGVGPSDEDPVVSDETTAGLRQLMIMKKIHGPDGKAEGVCMHTFHPGCLVSAERVALGGADVNVIEGGDVEVSCPICRSAGCVSMQEWDEGVSSLA